MSDASKNGQSKLKRQRTPPKKQCVSSEPLAKIAKVTELNNARNHNGDSQKNLDRGNGPDPALDGERETDEDKAREIKRADFAVAEDAQDELKGESAHLKEKQPTAESSDWAAMAAAEALASLTRSGGDAERNESPKVDCNAVNCEDVASSAEWVSPPNCQTATTSENTTEEETTSRVNKCRSVRVDSEGTEIIDTSVEDDEGGLDTGSSSSSASSSCSSENGDNECAIVSVDSPETQRSLEMLMQVQNNLENIEKRASRIFRRLELKFSQMRRPHLEQRNEIIRSIPGFWVTAFLNHPQLSALINENDEDALSYMTSLEVEDFKNPKLGYRIRFHFGRNPYFQNKVIVKEFHLGVAGSAASVSSPIFWLRGQNLAAQNRIGKCPANLRVYQSFFNWFTDHSNPHSDEIAEILKEDLWKNPLQYYLIPQKQSGENGRGEKSGNGDECVVISDSDEDMYCEDEQSKKDDNEMDDSSEEDTQLDGEVVIDGSEDGESTKDETSRISDDEEIDVEELEEAKVVKEPEPKSDTRNSEVEDDHPTDVVVDGGSD
ncbi:testis specific protein Y-linked [Erpetoichthys calabaricus]|uniref:Testis specific protein Y-linked n=1 Tax=Erpetoichthys calabaricus TaxID=27687 RepID=A0A8C4T7H7_ERPCA|nr:testis specific protein Y-linked [Erpetoichthys calabaricus]